MLNVFQIAPQDQSILYLGQIFGNVGIALAGTGPALLANMFRVFNTALLVIGTLIVSYTTVVGVLKTANEGEFLGRQWNSLWVPLRMVGGIVALMPTKTGYCAIQVIVMWVIVQGIGAADMVWKSAVDYFAAGGAIQTPSVPPDMTGAMPDVVKNLFANITCQAAVVKNHQNDANAVAHSALKSDGTGYNFGRPKESSDSYDPSAECGSVSWGSSSTDQKTQAREMALQTLVPVLENIANFYVGALIADTNCWGDMCTDADRVPPATCPVFNIYKDADAKNPLACMWASGKNDSAWNKVVGYAGSNFVSDSVSFISGAAYNYVTTNLKPQDLSANEKYDRMYKYGWIFAGAYYYDIARDNKSAADDYRDVINGIAVTPATDFNNKNNKDFQSNSFLKTMYQNALTIAQLAVDQQSQGIVTRPGIGTWHMGTGGAGPLANKMYGTAGRTLSDWQSKLAPDIKSSPTPTNPLVAMQGFGESLLVAAETLFWAFLGLGLIVAGVTGAGSTFFFGSGTVAPAMLGWLTLTFVFPAILFMIGCMITIGGLLGVYLPLLPYMLFVFGAIGWMVAAIEAMVAGPIIAIGILSPGGHHEILGRAEPSLMILLNILLRPTLMVFGMMGGLLLSYVVAKFINAAFYNVMASVSGGGGMGLFEGVIFIFAYTGILIAAVSKCFSLIHIVPDKVLRWIGGHAESFGEEQMAESARGRISAGGEGVSAAAKGAPSGIVGGVKEKAREDHGRDQSSAQVGAINNRNQNPPGRGGAP